MNPLEIPASDYLKRFVVRFTSENGEIPHEMEVLAKTSDDASKYCRNMYPFGIVINGVEKVK